MSDFQIRQTKEYEALSIDSILNELNSSMKNGLSEENAKKRIEEAGYNEIPEKEESLFHRIFRRFWGPIPWMIEVAAILSAAVQKWEDFGIITALLLVNAGMDLWQENKAINALKVLKEKLARTATVLRDGKFQTIDAKFIVPGDIIKIKIGEIIPADVKLLEGEYIQVDQAALTGESLPVAKHVNDIAYANSVAKQGEMLAVVVNTGLNTFFGKTVALVAKAEKEERSHFQKMVVKVGNFLIFTTIIMAVIILLAAIYRGENMLEIVRFTLVLTVAAIPVALPAVLTVTMAVGAMNLAKKKAIVSRLAAIEELAGTDILCSDKTGTLTKNEMTIAEPVLFGEFSETDLMLFSALASKEENNDPIEKPVYEYLQANDKYDELKKYQVKKFIPFDPVNKRTEAIVNSASGEFVVTKGAPQVIMKLCGGNINKELVVGKVNELAEKAYRTLGVAVKKKGEKDFAYVGLIPLYDPPRDDAKQTIADANKLGLDVKMITGDNVAIANQIALKLGMKPNILEADELKGNGRHKEFLTMSKILAKAIHEKLSPDLPKDQAEKFAKEITQEIEKGFETENVGNGGIELHESEIIKIIEDAAGFAQVFPEDKYMIVEKLQKGNHIIGMTGDGVNDAPALKKADVGIAVSGATDAARAAADLVLLSPGISVIVDALKQARIIFERMKSYTIYRIAETIRVIIFMTLAILLFNFYPVTAIMIILLALLNDIPILTISYDNTKIDEKPVRWNNRELFGLSTLLGLAGVVSSFLIFFLLETFTTLSQPMIQSIIFVKLIVAGHGTIYNTRTTDWFFKKPFPAPKLFWASMSTAALGTLIGVFGWYIPAIGWKWAGIVWAYAFSWFLVNDVVKVIFYRKLIKENKLFDRIFKKHNLRTN
ncbi:MAG: plasma-membrane proton-efflux P-type ATPase [Chlorobi bacterium]|nr:plasma-membrane proton-efflux P-type ATPase [Chlorobiota bacterium]